MLNTKNITDQEPLQKVPSLKTYCQNCVRRNISKVYELNEMPYHLLHDILANISPFHLKRIEDLNPVKNINLFFYLKDTNYTEIVLDKGNWTDMEKDCPTILQDFKGKPPNCWKNFSPNVLSIRIRQIGEASKNLGKAKKKIPNAGQIWRPRQENDY